MASKENSEKPSSSKKPEEKPLEVTSIADIKSKIQASKEGEPIKLPSGNVFRLTKPTISKLLKQNVFPQELVSAAIKLDSDRFDPTTKEDYLQYLRLIDQIVYRACVSPKISLEEENVDENSVYIDDLDDTDKVAIYIYVQMGVKPFESFRGEQQNGDSGSGMPQVPKQETK